MRLNPGVAVKQATGNQLRRRQFILSMGLFLGVSVLLTPTASNATDAGGATPTAVKLEAEDFNLLPPGPGREAVYFSCTACHAIQQVTQQKMTRAEWDKQLDWMVKNNGMHPLNDWARGIVLNYLATHFAPSEDWDGLPAGDGREEVFYTCQACHSLAIVKQQGLTKQSWHETLVWMIEEQGMGDPGSDDLDKMASYLAQHYGVNR